MWPPPKILGGSSPLSPLGLRPCMRVKVALRLGLGLWSVVVHSTTLCYCHTLRRSCRWDAVITGGICDVKGLQQLRVLRLDDNRLSSIGDDAFTSTPLLTQLDLGDNGLSQLAAGTLTPLTQLRQLSLDGNRFKAYNNYLHGRQLFSVSGQFLFETEGMPGILFREKAPFRQERCYLVKVLKIMPLRAKKCTVGRFE